MRAQRDQYRASVVFEGDTSRSVWVSACSICAPRAATTVATSSPVPAPSPATAEISWPPWSPRWSTATIAAPDTVRIASAIRESASSSRIGGCSASLSCAEASSHARRRSLSA